MLPITRSCKCSLLAASSRGRKRFSYIAQRTPKTNWRIKQLLSCDKSSISPPLTWRPTCLRSYAELRRSFSTTPNAANNEDDEEEIVSTYSRISPLEHILLRPGMYIGPAERLSERCMVLDPESVHWFHPENANRTREDNIEIQMRPRITHRHPALLKIFDEILVNASDNRLRATTTKPKSSSKSKITTTKIDVSIDPGCVKHKRRPFISVRNNGQGIPIRIHDTENIYIPELVFGHLLTGSNFQDEHKMKRLTGGRHGYGAKLTNIFSSDFSVKTYDSKKKLLYSQHWTNNMKNASTPIITPIQYGSEEEESYTEVSFQPDLKRLISQTDDGQGTDANFSVISEDDFAHMCQRVFDIAGCCSGIDVAPLSHPLKVTLNGRVVPIHSFEEYCQLVCGKQDDAEIRHGLYYKKINSRWEIGISLSESDSFESLSFVNGMFTSRGGTHVNGVVQQIVKHLSQSKQLSEAAVSLSSISTLIRRNLFICVNALIENPEFDSQMKESLTTHPTNFGSQCHLSEHTLKEIVKQTGLLERLIQTIRGAQEANIIKKIGSYGNVKTKANIVSMIPKLEDAHLAGQPVTVSGLLKGEEQQQRDCTLILTEGDSAKALAVAGLEVVGRDRFGVFPLRGKFLNVRSATLDQIANNEELKNLCTILGLDFKKAYKTQAERGTLRYDKIMIMADQDADGSHIKGLIINVFRCFWPGLLMSPIDNPAAPPFLSFFMTPLIKATLRNKPKGKKNEVISFFSMIEYNSWKESLLGKGQTDKYEIKYYKGLGTSTSAEAREYFKSFSSHYRAFEWASDVDGKLLDMLFDKNRAIDRRSWMLNSIEENHAHPSPNNGDIIDKISYERFIGTEMINFANADNIRSIPCFVDGLKPSQRKVLYSCFKRNLNKEIKVAQLSGYCAEHTAYHHGEASLHATIIGMAQNFVGSNNWPLLVPSGQFGTRLTGGQDAASPRYIFTKLADVSRLLFPEADDNLLEYNDEDGQTIEPIFFCPVIPLVLVNGAQGIGTGWSTFIPPCNIIDVIDFILCKIDGKQDRPSIRPHVNGFKGSLGKKEDGTGFVTRGVIKQTSTTSLVISELPVGTWTNNYKLHLIKMRNLGKIQSFVEDHTTTSVSFTVNLTAIQLKKIMKKGDPVAAFRLETSLPTSNMHLFDEKGMIRKFMSAEEIVEAFFPIRLEMYNKRKRNLEYIAEFEAALLQSKAKFIEYVTDGKIDLVQGRLAKADLVHVLSNDDFKKQSELTALKHRQIVGVDYTDVEGSVSNAESEYNYLLNMPISSLTTERVAELRKEAKKKEEDLEIIRKVSAYDLWKEDLIKLRNYASKVTL